jgi:uncharacterized protein
MMKDRTSRPIPDSALQDQSVLQSPGTIITESHFPGRAPIDAYGNGGFRFAEMSHRGGLLALPSGIYGWSATVPEDVTFDRLDRVVAEADEIELVFLGMGDTGVFPSSETRKALRDANIRFEVMSTGAAIRTFNVILGEGRPVAAALLPVESVR